MKKSAKAFSLLLFFGLLLSACTQSGNSSRPENTLIVAISNPNAKLDLHLYQWSNLWSMYDHVVQTLYTYDENLAVIPLLAEDYPLISEEGTLYTFTLKEGITFHDGSPLTSEDVQFTFQRLFDTSISDQIAVSSGSYEMIVGAKELMAGRSTGPLPGFKIIDDRSFSIELEHAFAPFVLNLAMSYVGIISKEAYLATPDKEQWGFTHLVGSGPYTFEYYHPRNGVALNVNENYWTGFRAAIDRIEFHFFDDPGTALLEYEKGNVHHVELPINRYAEYAKGQFAGDIIEDPMLGTQMIIANFEGSPFSNPLVREAFAYALDKKTLVEQVYMDILEVRDNFLPVGIPGHNSNIQAPTYNPVRAKELLAQAGYPNGVEIEASFRTGNPARRQLWTLIQAHAAPAGFTISLREMDIGQYTELNHAGQLLMNDAGWIASFADADDLMYTFFHSNWSHLKSSNLKNDRVDELLDAAQRSTEPEERKRMYEEIEQIVVADTYAVYPYSNMKILYLINPKLLNSLNLNGLNQFWNSSFAS
jgi:ABC-type transport system substrate-binding protein